jgi:uncharacterized protein (TIGR02145 family)/uncharacterized repeat protein (TIGR02543 family)
MRHSLASFVVVCSIPTILFLSCMNQTISPYDISKTEITVFAQPSSGILGFSNIEDTVGNTVNLGAQCNWWNYVDSVQFRQVAQTSTSIKDSMLTTMQKVSKLTNKDTLWHSVIFSEMGTKTIKAMAYLNNGVIISDSITIIIYPKLKTDDTQPPNIRLLSPVDSGFVTASSCQVKIICKDQSGIALVKCFIGPDSFIVTNSDSIYSSTISGLIPNRIATIMFIASDASPRMNKDTLFAHVKYDSVSIKNDSNLTLQYDGNGNTGGIVPVDSVSYQAGAKVLVKANIGSLVKTGSTFAGWNSKADGTGTGYLPGATFSIGTSNMTLYAIWKIQPTLSITYSDSGKTGGNAPRDTNKYATGDSIVVLGNSGNLVKVGFSFAGWNTNADGSGTDYNVGSKFVMSTTSIAFYVKWTTNPTYTLVYHKNGADSGSAPEAGSYEAGAFVTVLDNVGKLKKTGYDFGGWNTRANGGGTSYAAGATFTKAAVNDTLYVLWKNYSYIIIFDGQQATTPPDPARKTVASPATTIDALPARPEKIGFSFGGWFTAVNGGGTEFTVTTPITSNDTVYAKWIAATYTIFFNDQDATTHVSPTSKPITTPETTIGSLPTEPKKTGYVFGGWFTEINGGGTEFTATATVLASDTVYAKWNSYTYTVTYDSRSIVANTTKEVKSPKTSVETLPAPTANGYRFDGWYTDINGGGSPFLATTLVTDNTTVYAKWTPVFTVTYNANGGTGTVPIDSNKYTNGSTVWVLSGSTINKTNYSFGGWNTQADTLGASYLSGQTITMGSTNVNLYAKWRMDAPGITTQPTNKTCPVNDSVTFTVVATGANLTYKWQKNGTNIDNANGASYITSALTVNDIAAASTYRCVVSNIGGSVQSNGATLSVSTLTDADGNVYHQVKIGSQVWTMENLRVTKYNDNTPIPLDTSTTTWANATTPEYCYFNNTNNAESIKKFGALYNWYVVSPTNAKNIAPAGWHVPTDAQWDILQNYLITNGYNWDGTRIDNKIAKSLAAKTDWNSSTTAGAIGNDLSTNNRSGFSALPSYLRNSYGYFSYIGDYGEWWSGSEKDATWAWCRYLFYGNDNLYKSDPAKNQGASVRLLKD